MRLLPYFDFGYDFKNKITIITIHDIAYTIMWVKYLNWIKNYKNFNFTFMIGLLLIISAITIWAFSTLELKSNELILTNQNLNLEEIRRAEGALLWWKTIYSSMIIPTTLIVTLSGTATILSSIISNNFKQKTALDKFEDAVQEICQQ